MYYETSHTATYLVLCERTTDGKNISRSIGYAVYVTKTDEVIHFDYCVM